MTRRIARIGVGDGPLAVSTIGLLGAEEGVFALGTAILHVSCGLTLDAELTSIADEETVYEAHAGGIEAYEEQRLRGKRKKRHEEEQAQGSQEERPQTHNLGTAGSNPAPATSTERLDVQPLIEHAAQAARAAIEVARQQAEQVEKDRIEEHNRRAIALMVALMDD